MVAISGSGGRSSWERCVYFAETSPAENASQVSVGPIAWERFPSFYCTSPKIPQHFSQNHIEPLPEVVLRCGPEGQAGTICGCFCARRWSGWPCGNVSRVFLCPGVAQNTALRVFVRFCVLPRAGVHGVTRFYPILRNATCRKCWCQGELDVPAGVGSARSVGCAARCCRAGIRTTPASVTLKAGPESERHPASCWDWRKFRPMRPGRGGTHAQQVLRPPRTEPVSQTGKGPESGAFIPYQRRKAPPTGFSLCSIEMTVSQPPTGTGSPSAG